MNRSASERLKTVSFFAIHAGAVAGAFYADWSAGWLVAAALSYCVRLFGVTGGHHRYFSHRSYRLPRLPQLLLAVIGTTAFQKGPLWWASHHRPHHRFSDQESDVHSPVERGLWWAHVGWLLSGRYDKTDLAEVKDWAKFPEILWVDRYSWLVSSLFLAACLAFGGWNGFYWVGIAPTVLAWHATMLINSVSHRWGSQPFETGDQSRNNALVGLIALGEGWHNNHHRYMGSAFHGFVASQWDVTGWIIRLLEMLGVADQVHRPPRSLVALARAGKAEGKVEA